MQTPGHRKRGTAMFRQRADQIDADLTIRRLRPGEVALERLAQRDSAEPPAGTVYAAIAADGSLLAAISLESGALVADPFHPTAHAADLLRAWAREVRGMGRRRRARGLPAVAASPAG